MQRRPWLLQASADAVLTVVCALLALLGSCSLPLACATLLIVPDAVGATVMPTGTLPPLASVPRAHTTTPNDGTQPAVATRTVAVGGNVSVNVTPVAASGPRLITLAV